MGKNKFAPAEKQEASSLSILALMFQWRNKHNQSRLYRLGTALVSILGFSICVLIIWLAIKEFENSWYAVYFLSTGNKLNWLSVFIVGINALRLLFGIGVLAIVILTLFTSEDSQIFDSLVALTVKVFILGFPIFSFLVGLQNLGLYNFIGWKHLSYIAIGEGTTIFLISAASISVFWGSKFQTPKKTVVFESLFNLVLLFFPITVIVTSSVGGFNLFPQWLMVISILVCLFIFIVGVDELRGKPSVYTYIVTTYRIFEVGHVSMQLLRKRSAEALADALLVYKHLTPEQQEALSEWILNSNKPSWAKKVWAVAKIVVSTILLTILVQEPAIIAFKWFLKAVFDYSY